MKLSVKLKDFEKHGVYGFVIHPRMGLPIGMDFLDTGMLSMMRVAIEEAERYNMKVILYDEGSYPSGSCEGQVVARNPDHAARGLDRIVLKPGEAPKLEKNWNLVAIVEPPEG